MDIDKSSYQVVFCDGANNGDDYVEHPRIYINVKSGKESECPYCGKKFSYQC